MFSIQEKTKVLAGYSALRTNLQTRINDIKIKNYFRLISGYRPLHLKSAEKRKFSAEEYNVFAVLKLHRLEAKFHTPLIADLLHPKQKHEQSMDNYLSFVKYVMDESSDSKWTKVTPFYIKVKTEAHTPMTGRIDILILNNAPDNRFAIIIENKIGAVDQDAQIWRYYTYAKKTLNLTDDCIKILYLCPDIKYPEPHSLNSEQRKQLTDAGILKCISYRHHITNWIDDCRNQITAPPVREILSQYLQTLKLICP